MYQIEPSPPPRTLEEEVHCVPEVLEPREADGREDDAEHDGETCSIQQSMSVNFHHKCGSPHRQRVIPTYTSTRQPYVPYQR